MTFWQFVVLVFNWIEGRTTRIISVSLGTVTTLTATGLIPEHQLKYWAGGIAILTYWRAQSISQRVDTATAIIASQPPTIQPGVK